MSTPETKPIQLDSSFSTWGTGLVMLLCLAGATGMKNLSFLNGLPKPVFWVLCGLPVFLCVWFHLHLNRHLKPLSFLLVPIFLVATVMVLCLLPDGLFAWRIR